MKLLVINPNTTASMTQTIGRSARAVAAPDTEIVAVSSPTGPASIESHYDEALAVPGLLAAIREHPADAYILACFGDPGLDAAREIAPGPVVGIAEAAMRTATYLTRSFSIVTTLARTTGRAQELVHRYGAAGYCRAVRACEVPVLDLETAPKARDAILEECRSALLDDGAEAIVLGCAGMADFCTELADDLGVPVIDGVAAAVGVAEGLVRQGLTTSRANEYAHPLPKRYSGALAGFGS
jgi:allantoin racemase